MTPVAIKTAELALGLYFGDIVAPDLPNGRLKGKMAQLSNKIMRKFRAMPKLNKSAESDARRAVDKFMDASKWNGKSRSYLTICNFLLALYEDRDYAQDLIPILRDIYDYYARVKRAPAACEWSAAEAAEKWAEVVA